METRQPAVWIAVLVTYTFVVVAFALRLLARRLKAVQSNWGDYIAWLSFIFTTAYSGSTLYKLHPGLGLHLWDLGLKDDFPSFVIAANEFFRLLWIDMWLYTAAIGFSKLAALALFYRIFGQSNIRVPLLVLMGTVGIWMMARIIIISLLCVPIEKFWHYEMTTGHCGIPTNHFFFGSTIPHLLMEVAIVILPCLKVWQLNLPLPQKIAVLAMFTSGILVCAASLVQLIQAAHLDTKSFDIWWTSTPQAISACLEINVGQFSTSLPNLRPILDIIVGRKSVTDSRTPYNRSASDRSGIVRKSNGLFSHGSRRIKPASAQTDSELEFAQYGVESNNSTGKAVPGVIWKSTTTDVTSMKRASADTTL